MKKICALLVLVSCTLVIPASAKPGKGNAKNEKASKAKAGKKGFAKGHPIFGDGKLHPVHDDKVIGKFKNADKIRKEVADLDEMEEDDLNEELSTISDTISVKKDELNKITKEKLTKILAKKDELLAKRSELAKEPENIFQGIANKVGSMMNDMELNKVEASELETNEDITTIKEVLAEQELLESYINSKLSTN